MKNRKVYKRMISILSAASMLAAMFSLRVSGDTPAEWETKISAPLSSKIGLVNADEKVPVHIWLDDVDETAVANLVAEETGLTRTNIQEVYEPISSSVFSTSDETLQSRALTQNSQKTKELRQKESVKTEAFVSAKRKVYRDKYTEKNTSAAGQFGIPDSDIIFKSKYSPMIIANVKKSKLEAIAKKNNVKGLELYDENATMVPDSSTSAIQSVEADYTRDVWGYDGSGIKVGMIDDGFPDPNYSVTRGKVTQVGNGSVGCDGHSDSIYIHPDHAVNVASMILNTAPGCHIYAADWSDNSTSWYTKIENLIDCGVSVINQSAGFYRSSSWYDPIERWVDHIGGTHEISFVNAAGNEGKQSDGTYKDFKILSPGLAYNVITVGAIDDKNTGSNYSDDVLADYSSYVNGDTEGCAKPDVLAPGNVYGDAGTSYAAPIVTGIIAQMQECRPALKTNSRIVKAVLSAGCDRKVPGESMGGLTAKQGAGVVNAKKSITILNENRYTAFHFEAGVTTINKSIAVNSGDNKISIAYAWTRTNGATGSHSSGTAYEDPYINVSEYVYKPSGVEQGQSVTSRSSVELVYFSPTSYGNYNVKLVRSSSTDKKVWGALAWY